MTLILSLATVAEEHYNNSLCATRVRIEQAFGLLKRQFSCLGSELRVAPSKCCEIIVACVVFHTFAVEQRDLIEVLDIEGQVYHEANEELPANVYRDRRPNAIGLAKRQRIVRQYFT